MADTEAPTEQSDTPTPADALGDAGKRAVAAEREARKNAEREAAELRRQLETATADLAEKSTSYDSLAASEMRWRVAVRHGVTAEDAELFLTAADEETLTKQAERLTERIAAAVPDLPPPDYSQGGATPPPALNSDELTNALKAAVGV